MHAGLHVLPGHTIAGIDRGWVVTLAALALLGTAPVLLLRGPRLTIVCRGKQFHKMHAVSMGQVTLKKLLRAALQSKGSEPDMCTSQPASCNRQADCSKNTLYDHCRASTEQERHTSHSTWTLL